MKNVEGKSASLMIDDFETFILDVRTPLEFKQTSLPRAILIPVDQLAQRLDELPESKSKPILVYCAHGVRSVFASNLLEQNGYTQISNLRGGLANFYGAKA